MIGIYVLLLGIIIAMIIHYLIQNTNLKLYKSGLYSTASAFCFTSFLIAVKFSIDPLFGWGPAKTWSNLPYGTYPIWILAFTSLGLGMSFLAKSLE